MEKRTLFAIILIIVVFWLSNEFLWKPSQQQKSVASQPVTEEPHHTTEPTEQNQIQTDYTTAAQVTESDITINDAIILENDEIRVTLSNRGGTVTSLELKAYTLTDKETPANLIPAGTALYGTSLIGRDGSVRSLESTPFTYQMGDDTDVRFSLITDEGRIDKTFRLTENYQIDYTFEKQGFEQFEAYTISLDSGIADTETYLKMKNREYKVVAQVDNDITRLSLAKLKEKRELSGSIDWVAIKSKYFALGLIPDTQINMNRLVAFTAQESPAADLTVALSRTAAQDHFTLYCGPLIYDNLKQFGYGFENTVEMGPKFLLWISRIFLWLLTQLYSLIPVWGWTLIAFSVILKALLYPVTHKSFESTSKMQKIQPQVKEIQAKYKNDPQTMNAEMQKVYKEHGVSPFGGCLWMLIQMPILFALYPLLRYNINLRQSEFMWLPDLSEPDPLFILPIVMAIFMFVQQRLAMPSKEKLEKMDEKQQAAMQSQKMMMYIMPVMMFFIFRSLSSGLVLYWTVFNIISVVQQRIINKKLK